MSPPSDPTPSLDLVHAPLDELEQEAERLLRDLLSIDQQLAEPVHRRPSGEPMEGAEFEEWRAKAIRTKNAKTMIRRSVLRAIRKRRRESASAVSPTQPSERGTP